MFFQNNNINYNTNIINQKLPVLNGILELNKQNSQMVFSMNIKNPNPITKSNTKEKKIEEHPKKNMVWGAPIWFFLHTFAHKIKDSEFSSVRKDILSIILTICSNLPCPECSNHAKEYLNKINYNAIQTKQQLKDVLFNFHNMVNERKHFTKFNYSELDAKYSNAIFINIFNNFILHYTNGNGNSHMIADIFYRTKVAENTRKWLETHQNLFD